MVESACVGGGPVAVVKYLPAWKFGDRGFEPQSGLEANNTCLISIACANIEGVRSLNF